MKASHITVSLPSEIAEMKNLTTLALVGLLISQAAAVRAAETGPKLESIGPMAFGPEGTLFIADPKQATVFAVETGDNEVDKKTAPAVEGLGATIADMLGTERDGIQVKDLAINPVTGRAYIGVHRGRGPNATPVILTVTGNKVSEFSLKKAKYTKASLPNAPKDELVGRGRRQRNLRLESITDLAFVDGQVIVAGLSNEEFASKLRVMEYPFADVDAGTSVEVYHGAHGALETRSPVRTFIPVSIGDKPHLLAAYTCTPLVKFPLSDLAPGQKIRGTTVAELGNQNAPLDMVAYKKNGRDYLLIANNRRGVMKVDTADVATIQGISERVPRGGTAGLKYDTIDEWQGVVQLEQFDDAHATVIVAKDDNMHLKTVALP